MAAATSSSWERRQTLVLVPERKKRLSNLVTLAGEVLLGGHLLLMDGRQTFILVLQVPVAA